jgi:hypothetical protein
MSALSQRRRERYRSVSDKKFLPSAPLAAAVMHLAEREGRKAVCERAGIPERVLARWVLGEQGGNVDIVMADQVMTRLDLFWWEVWTEESVREPLFVVTTYRIEAKRDKAGEYKRRRIKYRTVPYGDLGTDFWRLREIGSLMTGGLDEGMAA